MAIIRSISYERGFIPDNPEPELYLKKYENEKLGVVLDAEDEETVEDLYHQAEKIVLQQQKVIEERREARQDLTGLKEELANINHLLSDIENNMMDKDKLQARKKKIEQTIISVE